MEHYLEIQSHLRYTFQDKNLLKTALCHSSYSNENKKQCPQCNERLEFLGDSVLSIITSDYLFKNYDHLPEGDLTKLRASLVCESALAGFAEEIHLGEYLLLGNGEENMGGRKRPSILADAFEAVLAAIYLDGGMEQAREYVLHFIKKSIRENHVSFFDYKTALQEIIQQNKEEKVEYILVSETGPDHDKKFKVELHLNSNVIGAGEGRSKKQAEQMAAKEAMELMGR